MYVLNLVLNLVQCTVQYNICCKVSVNISKLNTPNPCVYICCMYVCIICISTVQYSTVTYTVHHVCPMNTCICTGTVILFNDILRLNEILNLTKYRYSTVYCTTVIIQYS